MRLVTYSKGGVVSCGIMVDEGVIDIQSLWRGPKLKAASRAKLITPLLSSTSFLGLIGFVFFGLRWGTFS